MIRRGSWKYVYTHGEAAQLYDLSNDPAESENLATDPQYRAIRDELHQSVFDGWDVPDLARELTARESRFREKEEYLRSKNASRHLR